MTDKLFLKVNIKNKDQTVLEEEIEALSSFNEKGPFDILPLHENFISIIKDKIILHKKDGTSKEIAIERGVLKIIENEIDIYLGV
ncbi:hypothetical protein M1307_02920 [Patescibacteria group bacterium]|nr:hypothetical protein [Patescibacteria group bacterium]